MARDDSDTSKWDALLKRVRDIDTAYVKVGVLSGNGQVVAPVAMTPDGAPATLTAEGGPIAAPPIGIAELAAIHEFGSPAAGIPERSFLRATLRNKSRAIIATTGKIAKAYLAGRVGLVQGLGLLGAFVSTEVKKTITEGAGVPPPNAPSTIARKGSARPLVDTGRLLGSITWEIGNDDP